LYGVGLAVELDELDEELDEKLDELDPELDELGEVLDVEDDVELVVVEVVEVDSEIVTSSSWPELFSSMIAVVPPSTGRVAPPTETAPPRPIPTTIHPTCALAVCPLLTVSVFEALLNSVDVLVEFLAVVVAGRGDGFRVLVDVGLVPRELGDCGSWLVVPFVGLSDVLGLDVRIIG